MSQNFNPNRHNDDDELNPEYDFSKGLRGVHAFRFAKLSSDESLILGYWQGNAFDVASFSKAETRDKRTPDFRLSRDGKVVALCEVKSFQRDAWLDEQLQKAPPAEVVGGIRPDPVFNRVSNAIHTAFKQFDSANPSHELFNFLVLVNHDPSAHPEDLDRVLTGREDPLHGVFDPTCLKFSQGRIREEKNKIDLYVWFDFLKADSIRVRRLFFANPATQESVCQLLGIDPENVNKITPAA
jgi:hypothetical protein